MTIAGRHGGSPMSWLRRSRWPRSSWLVEREATMSAPTSLDAQPAFTFALERCVAFDVEVFPGRWAVGFYGPSRAGGMAAVAVDGEREELVRMLQYLAQRGCILVGYNAERFDVPLIRAILAGLDPYPLAEA